MLQLLRKEYLTIGTLIFKTLTELEMCGGKIKQTFSSVLTAGKGLKCKRFLIMQRIPPPMAISTSNSIRCNI